MAQNRDLVARPLKSLKNLEKITIDGQEVTLTTREEAQITTMTREQFAELGGQGWLNFIPVDKKTVIEIETDGDRKVFTHGKPPKQLTKYTAAQNTAQAVMSFLEAGAATYVIKQINSLCDVDKPYCGGSLKSFAINGFVLEILREIVHREKPFVNYYRAQGDNKWWQGLLKIGTSNIA